MKLLPKWVKFTDLSIISIDHKLSQIVILRVFLAKNLIIRNDEKNEAQPKSQQNR